MLDLAVLDDTAALKVDKDHLTTQFADLEAWYARTVNVGLAAGFTLPPGEVADVDVDDAGGAASSSAAASSPQDKEDKGSATKRGAKSSSSPPSSSSSAAKRAKKGA